MTINLQRKRFWSFPWRKSSEPLYTSIIRKFASGKHPN